MNRTARLHGSKGRRRRKLSVKNTRDVEEFQGQLAECGHSRNVEDAARAIKEARVLNQKGAGLSEDSITVQDPIADAPRSVQKKRKQACIN